MMDDDGLKPIATDHLSDSGDLSVALPERAGDNSGCILCITAIQSKTYILKYSNELPFPCLYLGDT